MDNKENKAKSKIENAENESKNVSGGFIGDDWSDDYKKILENCGITHIRKLLGRDKYSLDGKQITKEEAQKMAEKWIHDNVPGYKKED